MINKYYEKTWKDVYEKLKVKKLEAKIIYTVWFV